MSEVDPNDPQDHAFNETDFQELRDAVNSGDWKRRSNIAQAEMWPSFLKAHPEEGWRLFKKLAADKDDYVRWGAAKSPAWPMLLEMHHAEAWHLFEKLAKDKKGDVRWGAAESPVWPDLTKLNLSQSLQIFAELMSDHNILRNLADLPSWKAFGKVPPTAVAERDSQELLGIARSLQKVADAIRWLSHESHEIKGLALFDGFSTALRRSTNETWLGEMVKFSLFASNATLRVSPAENIYLDCLSEFFRKRIV